MKVFFPGYFLIIFFFFVCIPVPCCPLKENSGFLLNALLKRGLSEEHPVPDTLPMAPAAVDAFKVEAMTPEPEDLETVAPNSAAPSPPQPYPLAPGPQHSLSSSGPGSGSGDPLEEELRCRLRELVSRANSKDSNSSEEDCAKWPADKQMDKECEGQREKTKLKDAERQRESDRLRASSKEREKGSETGKQVNGQEMSRRERLIKSPSMKIGDEGRVRERRLQKGVDSLEEKVDDQEQKRGDRREGNRQSKRQHKRDMEKEAGQKGGGWRSGSSASTPAVTPSSQEGVLSDNQVR